MASDNVYKELCKQVANFETEAETAGKTLAAHQYEVESKVAAIAETDVALGTLNNVKDPALNQAVAFLRSRRDNLVNELSTAQGQVTTAQAAYDAMLKTLRSFEAAAEALAPRQAEPPRTRTAKGK